MKKVLIHPSSDHYDGNKFFNPDQKQKQGFWDVVKFLTSSNKQQWPKENKNEPKPRLSEKLSQDQIAITFINHATVLIQTPDMNIITDPVYSERVSPFTWVGPKRYREPGIAFEQLPKIDLVLVSHNHYDHLDKKALQRLKEKFDPAFVVALGDKALLEEIGISKVTELDWWQSVDAGKNTQVTFAPTQHFSGRGLFDRDKTLWGSFFINAGKKKIYFGGDAAYSKHYKEIQAKLGAPDIALIPIGAYEPRWFMSVVHMNPDESVQAHIDLGSKKSIGIHFGTFQLTDEAIDQPVKDLEVAKIKYHLTEDSFVVLKEGQTTIY